MNIFDTARNQTRRLMRYVAVWLDKISRGRVSPNTVTLVGVAMHIPIAFLIATDYFIPAAILLVIFGSFDMLDGELARVQKRATQQGMLLDASTDRLKEVMLYTGAAYILALGEWPEAAAIAVVACGASLSVSYIKAKGEAAVASMKSIPHHELNRLFADGLMRFEVRMLVLILGLLFDQLLLAVAVIAILATYTALQRLVTISRRLADAKASKN